MPDSQTFKEWLESQRLRRRTRPWTLSDVRAGFEAGRRAGLEEAAEECERMAAVIRTAREEQYSYEQEHGYTNSPLRAGYTSEIQALTERATYLRALASAPVEAPAPGTGEASHG